MLIQMGTAVARAIKQTVGNMLQRQSGLYVPAPYIAGRHFGGFTGYEPWIQDCIRTACLAARGVGPDELSEITAIASWVGPAEQSKIVLAGQPAPEPAQVGVVFFRHAEAMARLRSFVEAVGEASGHPNSLSSESEQQYMRVQGSRQLGTLIVVALNFSETERLGKLMTSVSAWNPAEIEEAKAVPRQQYLAG